MLQRNAEWLQDVLEDTADLLADYKDLLSNDSDKRMTHSWQIDQAEALLSILNEMQIEDRGGDAVQVWSPAGLMEVEE
ncbi:MAG: hypothetical protein U5L00_06775 [Desulfovermiculus sp.]|nr:hypothetical protein [Desulfovermiculus sp.]